MEKVPRSGAIVVEFVIEFEGPCEWRARVVFGENVCGRRS
jgi:hypothetical protein